MLSTMAKAATSAFIRQSTRSITAKALRQDESEKCPPWPYKEIGFKENTHFWIDDPRKRMDDSSKLIVVEGNTGSGKSVLAKKLAEGLDFLYMPAFKMDDILVNYYGKDRRELYPVLPPATQIPDIDMFYKNPRNPYNAQMQYHMAFGRFEQFMNAVAHILNTGKGVVLDRSFHSDFVFVNAGYEKGIYSYDFFRWYHAMRKYMLPNLYFWPHLVIYLDAPVEQCMKRIERRGKATETQSGVIDPRYLDTMRESYKDLMKDYQSMSAPVDQCMKRIERRGKATETQSGVIDPRYLDTMRESYKDLMKDYQKHSRMLIYDWESAADPERVLEDVEKMDLDYYEWHDGDIVEEWSNVDDMIEWNNHRTKFTDKLETTEMFQDIPTFEVDELNWHPEEKDQFLSCMKAKFFGKFASGFDPAVENKWDIFMAWDDREHVIHTIGSRNWYDHYYRDVFFGYETTATTFMDRDGAEGFNPHYHPH